MTGSRKPSPQDIADALRDRIRTGTLKPGDRLPTQARLAEEFGVERGTVRQALHGLHRDGLINHVTKGSPPRVAAPAEPAVSATPEPQPSMVALAPRLVAAFKQPHVRVDAVSFTAETLMNALTEPIRQIHAGLLHPNSIDVRILLPSSDIELAFPVPVAAEAEDEGRDRLHQRWLAQRNAQGQVLRHNLLTLRNEPHGIDVHVTFRALPFTSPVKLYVLNGHEALLAYYTLHRDRVELDAEGGETLELWDAGGLKTPLFSFTGGTNPRDSGFVEESQKWFDALWETITTDLTLS
nr:GntR family transcriptional regulator [Streptomyces sp. NRRL B-1347]